MSHDETDNRVHFAGDRDGRGYLLSSASVREEADRRSEFNAAYNIPFERRWYPRAGEFWRPKTSAGLDAPELVEQEFRRAFGPPEIHLIEQVGVTTVWTQTRQGTRIVYPLNTVWIEWERVRLEPGQDWRAPPVTWPAYWYDDN